MLVEYLILYVAKYSGFPTLQSPDPSNDSWRFMRFVRVNQQKLCQVMSCTLKMYLIRIRVHTLEVNIIASRVGLIFYYL